MKGIATFCLVVALPALIAGAGNCPQIYARFSQNHSFCKAPNPTCQVITKGVDQAAINTILDVHNKYRSKVASGQEKQAGGLPTASNMLQLTWDTDLAAVAQKWAEQCKFQHDCNECRSIRSFSAGQNIAYMGYYCSGGRCEKKDPDWPGTIKMFYDEVKDFHKSMVKSVNIFGGKMIGHFTQVSWAETYKVGCGYVSYSEGGSGKHFYVCNYGPAGNMQNAPMYKEGPPCSACPKNSCCGSSCGGDSYPALCKLNGPPEYVPQGPTPYLCTFQSNDAKCQFRTEGPGRWEITPTSGGNFLSLVAQGGSTNVARFSQRVRVKRGSCFILTQRRGPTEAGKADQSSTEVEFEQNGRSLGSNKVWSVLWSDFMDSPVQISTDGEITVVMNILYSPQGLILIKDVLYQLYIFFSN